MTSEKVSAAAVRAAITLSKMKAEMELMPESKSFTRTAYGISASLFADIKDSEKLRAQIYYLAFQILDFKRKKGHQNAIFYLDGIDKDEEGQRLRSEFKRILGDESIIGFERPAEWGGAFVLILDPRHEKPSTFKKAEKTLYTPVYLDEDSPPGWTSLFLFGDETANFYASQGFGAVDTVNLPDKLYNFYNGHLSERLESKKAFWDLLSGRTPGVFSMYTFRLPLLDKMSDKELSLAADSLWRSVTSSA
jgi:hypothetical protein